METVDYNPDFPPRSPVRQRSLGGNPDMRRTYREKAEREFGGLTVLGVTSLWQRSRCQPVRLGEFVQAVVLLAFSFVIPVLVVPTVGILLILYLDRLGLTLLGMVVALMALAAFARVSLVGLSWMSAG
jgi:hypothetical protein